MSMLLSSFGAVNSMSPGDRHDQASQLRCVNVGLFCMTVFLAKLTGVVCHCLPLVLPAVPVCSPFCEGKGTNGLHHAKVGTEDFGSSAQVGSKTPIQGYVVWHSSLCYSGKPEWLIYLYRPFIIH